MRYVPGSHRPEQPRWLAPLIHVLAAGALTLLALRMVHEFVSIARGGESADYLAIKNSTGRPLRLTFDGRSISVPHDASAAWRLPGPPPVRGGTVRVDIVGTDESGREWRWSECLCSFVVRDGKRYTLVRLIGPLD